MVARLWSKTGDNYITGWSDHDWKQRPFDDNFVDASEAHSHLPSLFGQGAPRESVHATTHLRQAVTALSNCLIKWRSETGRAQTSCNCLI